MNKQLKLNLLTFSISILMMFNMPISPFLILLLLIYTFDNDTITQLTKGKPR